MRLRRLCLLEPLARLGYGVVGRLIEYRVRRLECLLGMLRSGWALARDKGERGDLPEGYED
jgi:hypothetical protein